MAENRIYVGNLPYSTDNDTLATIFSDVGEVISARIILDRDTGRSKGFGFVELSCMEDVEKAIKQFHGQDYNGRPLTVSYANPKKAN